MEFNASIAEADIFGGKCDNKWIIVIALDHFPYFPNLSPVISLRIYEIKKKKKSIASPRNQICVRFAQFFLGIEIKLKKKKIKLEARLARKLTVLRIQRREHVPRLEPQNSGTTNLATCQRTSEFSSRTEKTVEATIRTRLERVDCTAPMYVIEAKKKPNDILSRGEEEDEEQMHRNNRSRMQCWEKLEDGNTKMATCTNWHDSFSVYSVSRVVLLMPRPIFPSFQFFFFLNF